MAIARVDRMWSRVTSGTSSADGTKFTARFGDAYQVEHDADETRVNILAHADVPQLGDLFTEGGQQLPGIYCVDRQLERRGPIFSVVNCTFQGEYANGSLLDDPLNKPPVITRNNRLQNVEIDQDFHGVPLTNSVGDPVRGLTTDVSDFSITITRNFSSIDMYAIRAYLRSHNSDWFDGWPPGTARFRTYTANEKRYQGQSRIYHEVTATIEFREPYNTSAARAWYLRYRNEGLNEVSGCQVAFSGGGGSGATAYAVTSSAGAVTDVVVTNRGTGYTSAPTVAFATTGSPAGAGATGTAVLTGDEVTSVTVGAGGTNYHTRKRKCVHEGEPVTSPVFLAANGTRLQNNDDAVWIERPVSGPLPYSQLGLL